MMMLSSLHFRSFSNFIATLRSLQIPPEVTWTRKNNTNEARRINMHYYRCRVWVYGRVRSHTTIIVIDDNGNEQLQERMNQKKEVMTQQQVCHDKVTVMKAFLVITTNDSAAATTNNEEITTNNCKLQSTTWMSIATCSRCSQTPADDNDPMATTVNSVTCYINK